MDELEARFSDTSTRSKHVVEVRKVSPWLLSSFGWCAADVSDMAMASRDFQQSLLQLTPRQFHVIGLSIAVLQSSPVRAKPSLSELAELIGSVPAKQMIVQLAGRCPNGVLNCLGKLPDNILWPSTYIELLKLLDEPNAAKVLFHIDRISSNTIGLLRRLDPALRRARLVALLKVPQAATTVDFLVNTVLRIRPDVARQAVLESVASVTTAAGLENWFCGWIEKAEFPAPPWCGNGDIVPLKSKQDMLEAARIFRNCLGAKIVPVITGGRYYYFHRKQPLVAIELINDRLAGWLVVTMRGVGNKQVPAALAARIAGQFTAAGVGSLPKFDRLPRGVDPTYWLRTDMAWLAA